ncbi:hypothetical protein V6Z11_A05G350600 [Gossypium hirsutum]
MLSSMSVLILFKNSIKGTPSTTSFLTSSSLSSRSSTPQSTSTGLFKDLEFKTESRKENDLDVPTPTDFEPPPLCGGSSSLHLLFFITLPMNIISCLLAI